MLSCFKKKTSISILAKYPIAITLCIIFTVVYN